MLMPGPIRATDISDYLNTSDIGSHWQRPLRLPRACVAVVDLVARRVDELLPPRRHARRAGRRWRRAGRRGPRRLCSGTSSLVEVVRGSREQQDLLGFRVRVGTRVRIRV